MDIYDNPNCIGKGYSGVLEQEFEEGSFRFSINRGRTTSYPNEYRMYQVNVRYRERHLFTLHACEGGEVFSVLGDSRGYYPSVSDIIRTVFHAAFQFGHPVHLMEGICQTVFSIGTQIGESRVQNAIKKALGLGE